MSNPDLKRLYAIVPAAGVGERMGAGFPKQYLSLSGKTLAEHTMAKLLSFAPIEQVVVSVSDNDSYWRALQIAAHKRVITVEGGPSRAESVLNALLWLRDFAAEDDLVLVHDMARPCLRLSDVEKLLQSYTDDGAILAAPVTDTIKRELHGNSMETLDRARIWRALTPQLFSFGKLFRALQKALSDGHAITDEASAMEHAGFSPLLVQGAQDNIKVTLPADLQLAEYYLERQKDEGLQWYE